MNPAPDTTSRTKVGQMSRVVRDEINRRLRAGQDYAVIADWANARSDVRAVLKQTFGGKPMTPTNVGEWRRNGGYTAWLQHLEGEEAQVQQVAAKALDAAAKLGAAMAAAVGEPLRVERALCGKAESGLPVLVLTVNGLPAQITVITTKWLAVGVVHMEGGPAHAAALSGTGKGKPRLRAGLTDDPVILELCRRVLFDLRAGTLVTGPREIPTEQAARASRWRISAQNDTIRREGDATA